MATLSLDAVKGGFDKSFVYERRLFKYTGPSSYATGGDSLTPEQCRLGMIAAVLGLTLSNGTNTYFGFYNPSTKKILWYSATNTEIGNAVDLSGYSAYLEVIGK